jgi:hypothetical protein
VLVNPVRPGDQLSSRGEAPLQLAALPGPIFRAPHLLRARLQAGPEVVGAEVLPGHLREVAGVLGGGGGGCNQGGATQHACRQRGAHRG